jgi:hypothetical protein
MPYYRYGNPECPKCPDRRETMIRAYIRIQKTTGGVRIWSPIGWYCQKCGYFKEEKN